MTGVENIAIFLAFDTNSPVPRNQELLILPNLLQTKKEGLITSY